MAYSKQTWTNNDPSTPVSGARLQHIEDGLEAAASTGDSASVSAATAQTTANAAVPKSTVTTAGDLIYATGNAAVTRLGIGAAGTVLKGGASAPSFATITNADVDSAAAIAVSKLADPGSGNVVTSAGAGAVAAKPPGYEYAYNEFTAPVATAVTTEATAATVVTASAVTFDGATAVWVEFSCPNMSNSVGTAFPIVVLYDGSASIGKMAEQDLFNANYGSPLVCKRRITPSAAAHTYSARIYTSAGTVTVAGGAGGVGNFMPGFIRITRA